MSVTKCFLCKINPDDPAHAATHAASVRKFADWARSIYRGKGLEEPLCQDCAVNTLGNETYWVWPWIWEEAKGDKFLCIGCLEKRLGRKLIGTDFDCIRENAVIVNYGPWWPRSKRLKARLNIPDGAEQLTAIPKITIQVDWQGGKQTRSKQKRRARKTSKRRK